MRKSIIAFLSCLILLVLPLQVPLAGAQSERTQLTWLGTLGGDYSKAEAVSADGSVVVGWAETTGGHDHAFRWTEDGGMEDLGTLDGYNNSATSVSADGRVVVGRAETGGGVRHAFRWTEEEGMGDLGTLGGDNSWALSVSADGRVVVGKTETPGISSHAFRWTEEEGMEDLNVVCGSLLDDSLLLEARDISPEGRFIAGTGISKTNRVEAFLLALGGVRLNISPSDFTTDYRKRVELTVALRSRGGPIPEAQINWSVDRGKLEPSTTITDDQGKASTTYTPPPDTAYVSITATYPGDKKHGSTSASAKGFVFYPIELRITEFYVKRDVDIQDLSGWADPYFEIDAPYNRLTAPKRNIEPNVKNDDVYPGPLFTSTLRKVTTSIEITAKDSDPFGSEELGSMTLDIESCKDLPIKRNFDSEKIFFKVEIETLPLLAVPDTYYPEGIAKETTPLLENQWYWFAVGADNVWKRYGEEDFDNVVVAVVGKGVDYNHPALEDIIWTNADEIPGNENDDDGNGFKDDIHGWNFAPILFDNNDPMDEDGHGTKVSGVLAAQAGQNYGVGIAGAMRKKIKIMPVRVGVRPWWLEWTNLLDKRFSSGIRYAVNNGADIINISIGGYSLVKYPQVADAVEEAEDNNVLVVASAGNKRTMEPHYPSSFEEVSSVSATTKYVTGLEYQAFCTLVSNYGPGPSSNFNLSSSVELSAPGQDIDTLDRMANGGIARNQAGTSLSAPIVSGVAAMMKGYAKGKGVELTPKEIRQLLRESALDLGPNGRDNWYGAGMVMADRALEETKVYIFEEKMSPTEAAQSLMELTPSKGAEIMESIVVDDVSSASKIAAEEAKQDLEKQAAILDEMRTKSVAKLLIRVYDLPESPETAAKLLETISLEKSTEVIQIMIENEKFNYIDGMFSLISDEKLNDIYSNLTKQQKEELLPHLSADVKDRIALKKPLPWTMIAGIIGAIVIGAAALVTLWYFKRHR